MKKSGKYLWALFPLIFSSAGLSGQQVISSAGAYATGNTLELYWTLGEPVISTFSGSNIFLTQGFHQGKLFVTAVGNVINEALNITVYPNPADQKLFLERRGNLLQDLEFFLYAEEGRLIRRQSISSDREIVETAGLKPGLYYLKVVKKGDADVYQTFKILKNQ